MKLRTVVLLLIVLVIGYVLFDSLLQPSTSSLKGDFKEVAVYRNPNNTGPVVRIYAVTVADTLWEEMEQYGKLMPYTKYGTTTVYFFKAGGSFPQTVHPGDVHFDAQFQRNCLGKYQKGAMAEEALSRFPFR